MMMKTMPMAIMMMMIMHLQLRNRAASRLSGPKILVLGLSASGACRRHVAAHVLRATHDPKTSSVEFFNIAAAAALLLTATRPPEAGVTPCPSLSSGLVWLST